MPEFLEEFIEQIRMNRESIRQKLTLGRVSELDSDLNRLINKYWYPLVEVSAQDRDILAVDGSRAVRPFASGANFYVARSLALYGKREFRELESNCFLCRAKYKDAEVFVNRKMEWLELKVALKAVVETNLSRAVVLLDGSLFGKMTHLPADQPAEGMKSFMIEYFSTFFELLEACKKRNVLLLGVSKDSKSSFLRNLLLKEILVEELQNLESIAAEDRAQLVSIFEDAFDHPAEAFGAFRKLEEIHSDKLKRMKQILYEAIAARPDHQLIRNYIRSTGHTVPIELSVPRRIAGTLKEIQVNPGGYVKRHFSESLLECQNENEFTNHAAKALSLIPRFPTMVSFHMLLDTRDTPIRVDTPSWTYNRDTKITDFIGSQSALLNVNEIIGLLLKGYGGLKDYNIWLKRVDEKVRLGRDTVDELYGAALQKAIGVTIIHSRGYRRVKYP